MDYEALYNQVMCSLFTIAKAVYRDNDMTKVKKVTSSALMQYLKDNYWQDDKFMMTFIKWLEEDC